MDSNTKLIVQWDAPFWRLQQPGDTAHPDLCCLHGYGQTAQELWPLASKLALNGHRVWSADLPGHGENQELLTPSTLKEFARLCADKTKPQVAVGYSLGARLALLVGGEKIVLISPPMDNRFDEQTRSELLHQLRPRWVRETKPMQGLAESLAELPSEAEGKILVLYAQKDFATVKNGVQYWQERATVKCLPHTDHLSIIFAPQTTQIITDWLAN